MRSVSSFSAKTKTDIDFIDKLKKHFDARGINFSFIVLKALKEAHPEFLKPESTQSENNGH